MMIRRFAASLLSLFALAACGDKTVNGYQGYAEGEFVLVAAPAAGQLVKRWVSRGQEVDAGDRLAQPASVAWCCSRLPAHPHNWEATDSARGLQVDSRGGGLGPT